ncbi:MAG: proteasome assembly chaperone family protein [Thermoplasmatota archaeon]
MSDINFNIIKEENIPDVKILVAGFPGPGLIGGIASEQLINSLEMEQVASLECDQFPPTAVVFDGIPRRPVRFFYGKGFLLVKSDIVIPSELTIPLADKIVDWCLKRGVEDIIIFDGIPKREEKERTKVWGVLSSHAAESEAEKLNVEIIKKGAISGISSSLILRAHEKHLKAVGMFAEGNQNIPDPRAAATLLDKFANYKGLEINTHSLVESAEKLEEQYSKLVEKTKETQESIEKRSAHPPLYG